MKLTKKYPIRAKICLRLSWIALICALPCIAQTVSTTTVQGTVYLASGTPASGTLSLSWPAFTTSNGLAIAADTLNASIGTNGFVSVNLAPPGRLAPVPLEARSRSG